MGPSVTVSRFRRKVIGSGLWGFGVREDRGGWSFGSGLEEWLGNGLIGGFMGVELQWASGFLQGGGVVIGDGMAG
ncbi:unnamed protein product [Dovyalis caffra]|uniref:Uncharacterized protein n=1 Tax=Dovyalis caffra TaxID=77055 RepID=A0AAV1RBS6_9ROSI|nr:unnamed protein product [Dovyalis caffra]